MQALLLGLTQCQLAHRLLDRGERSRREACSLRIACEVPIKRRDTALALAEDDREGARLVHVSRDTEWLHRVDDLPWTILVLHGAGRLRATDACEAAVAVTRARAEASIARFRMDCRLHRVVVGLRARERRAFI